MIILFFLCYFIFLEDGFEVGWRKSIIAPNGIDLYCNIKSEKPVSLSFCRFVRTKDEVKISFLFSHLFLFVRHNPIILLFLFSSLYVLTKTMGKVVMFTMERVLIMGNVVSLLFLQKRRILRCGDVNSEGPASLSLAIK